MEFRHRWVYIRILFSEGSSSLHHRFTCLARFEGRKGFGSFPVVLSGIVSDQASEAASGLIPWGLGKAPSSCIALVYPFSSGSPLCRTSIQTRCCSLIYKGKTPSSLWSKATPVPSDWPAITSQVFIILVALEVSLLQWLLSTTTHFSLYRFLYLSK